MSLINDLKNTKVSDAAFYLIFILAILAPGTSYAMYFFLDIFKELDTWKVIFMIIAISSPLIVVAILFAFICNGQAFFSEELLKPLIFFCCFAVLSSSYLSLVLESIFHWGFDLTASVAVLGTIILSVLAGLSSRSK